MIKPSGSHILAGSVLIGQGSSLQTSGGELQKNVSGNAMKKYTHKVLDQLDKEDINLFGQVRIKANKTTQAARDDDSNLTRKFELKSKMGTDRSP